MSQYDRDLATAIYDELTSEASVDEALDIWRFPFHEAPSDRRRMWLALQAAAAVAIDAVLARRMREAARTGPWGDYDEEEGYPWVMLPRKRTP